ncbi:MAG: hypothetical protein NW226_03785 [Microscillaceae bacterium]|nr:hypothetical protein [Microscillaceae bacterium]
MNNDIEKKIKADIEKTYELFEDILKRLDNLDTRFNQEVERIYLLIQDNHLDMKYLATTLKLKPKELENKLKNPPKMTWPELKALHQEIEKVKNALVNFFDA